MPDKIKIAAVQTNPKITKNKDNLDKILSEIETATKNGADLVVFSECALTGYVFSSREEALPYAESIPGASTDKLSACCRQLGIYAVVGLMEREAGRCYNAAVLTGPKGLIGKYRKNHLPFLGVDRFLDPGDQPFRVYSTPIGNIGIHICYDSAFPESTRVMALLGADIAVLPTNFPAGREKMLDYVVNTRALENKIHFVAVNRVGSERGTSFYGRSKIVNASGDTLIEASRDKEEAVYAEVSLAEAREKHIVFKAGEFELDRMRDRRPELYGEITKKRPK
jgi:predicted amidohydrolase